MITKEKSPLHNRLKYLAVLPLIFIMGFMICCTVVKSQDPVMPVRSQDTKVTTIEIVGGSNAKTIVAQDDPVYVIVEKTAKFQGGDIEYFREWVQKKLIYPREAVKNKIYGRVIVQFAINSIGKVCDIKVLRGADPLLDNETVRVIQLSPDWEPAKQKGKNVKQQFVMPVIFALQ